MEISHSYFSIVSPILSSLNLKNRLKLKHLNNWYVNFIWWTAGLSKTAILGTLKHQFK